MIRWGFHDAVTTERQTMLATYERFENIVAGLILAASVAKAIWEPFGETRLRGCHRAAFLLAVPPWLYDAFFNSPVGYRAQYAQSVELGERKNREVLDALEARLLASWSADGGMELARASLGGAAAKIWINESEVEKHLFEDTPEIDFGPWHLATENGAGLRAPVGTQLVVCGGWIDSSGRERLDSDKLKRSQEIHEVGFT
jgi:hypothetical protein